MDKVTRQQMLNWQRWTDALQYGSLGLLILTIVLMESLTKQQAKAAIWYCAGTVFTVGTIAFLVARISVKKSKQYFDSEFKRIKDL